MPARPSPRSTDPDCTAFLATLEAVVDGESDAATVTRSESHAAGCDECRRGLEVARAYRRRLRRVGDGERAPDALRAQVMDATHGMQGSPTP